MSSDGLQFQTAHGRQRVWVAAAQVPLLPFGIWLGGTLAGESGLPLAAYAVLVILQVAGILVWLVRRNKLGLIVAPTGVSISTALEVTKLNPDKPEQLPVVGVKHYSGMSWVEI